MPRKINFVLALLLATVVCLASSELYAQATRTWVSGVGDDVNPCSRTAPCKTFAGAISKTAAKGEINALDSGGFGGVTITKAMTIDGAGAHASALNAGFTGIIVNLPAATDVVILRNLAVQGAGTGGTGVRMSGPGTLIIENCVILNQSSYGIDITNGLANVVVRNTTIRNISGGVATAMSGIRISGGGSLTVEESAIANVTSYGIDINPTAATVISVKKTTITGSAGAIYSRPQSGVAVKGTIVDCLLTKGTYGVRAEDRSSLLVKDTVASNNTNNGFLVYTTSAAADVFLDGCAASGNGTYGVNSSGNLSVIRISDTTVTANTTGISCSAGCIVDSFNNNRIYGNSTDFTGVPIIGHIQQ